jgi:hypothetical protein
MGLQLAGNGGAGLFEAGVVQLVASLHGSAAGFTGAMLEGLGGLAAAAGLLRKPVADAGGDQHGAFTGRCGDTVAATRVCEAIRSKSVWGVLV